MRGQGDHHRCVRERQAPRRRNTRRPDRRGDLDDRRCGGDPAVTPDERSVRARRRVGRPDTHVGHPVDPAHHRTDRAGRREVGGRRRPFVQPTGRLGDRDGRARMGTLAPPRRNGARPRHRVLVPLLVGRVHLRDRPRPHHAGARCLAEAAPPRIRLVPGLHRGALRRPPSTRRRRTRPRLLPRGLHLRIPVHPDVGPPGLRRHPHDARRIPSSVRDLHPRRRPPGKSGIVPVGGHVGRPRGREQLRRSRRQRRHGGRRVRNPPRGRVPGVLRAVGAGVGGAGTG